MSHSNELVMTTRGPAAKTPSDKLLLVYNESFLFIKRFIGIQLCLLFIHWSINGKQNVCSVAGGTVSCKAFMLEVVCPHFSII